MRKSYSIGSRTLCQDWNRRIQISSNFHFHLQALLVAILTDDQLLIADNS